MERSGQTTQDQYIGYWNSFVFPINFKIAFSISVKDGTGFLIGIPFNPVDYYCYSHVLQSMNTGDLFIF